MDDVALRFCTASTSREPDLIFKALFDTRQGKHLDLRWEYLEGVLSDLRPLWRFLKRFYDSSKFGARAGDGSRLEAMRIAMEFDMLEEIAEVVGSLAECGRHARWCEGCWCHKGVHRGRRRRGKRQRTDDDDPRPACPGCPWKGRRLVQLSGQVACWTEEIRDYRSIRLVAMLQALPRDKAAILMEFEGRLMRRYIEGLSDKSGFVDRLPYKMVSMFSGAIGTAPIDCDRAAGRECLQEYDNFADPGSMHRVAHLFLSLSLPLRCQVEAFVNGDASLESHAELHCELMLYAFCPIVARRMAAEHAKLADKGKTFGRVPLLATACASIRASEDLAKLMDNSFLTWARRTWATRAWLRELLEFRFTPIQLRGMSDNEIYAHIFGYSEETRYEDVTIPAELLQALADERQAHTAADEVWPHLKWTIGRAGSRVSASLPGPPPFSTWPWVGMTVRAVMLWSRHGFWRSSGTCPRPMRSQSAAPASCCSVL